MAISAILLCFVGVWATQTALNLKFTGIVNPDILCKIEVKSTASETFTTIFDNSGSGTAEDYLDNQNRLNKFTTILDSNVATGLDFKLTNYTPTKHIRLSIKNILVDGEGLDQENLQATHTSASAEKMETTPNTAEFTLALTANKTGQFELSLSLLVEEVYKVTTSGEGLANPDKFFFAKNETPEIPLLASVSYQIPRTVIFNKIVNGTPTSFTTGTILTRTNNLKGTASFNSADLLENVSILCNCERVFLVEKNSNPSLFENGQQTMQGFLAPFDNTKTYMPNNGKYSYSADYGQVTMGDGFKEYPYYITLGEYPQSKVTDNVLIDALDHNATLVYNHDQLINKVQYNIEWYEYNGLKYVKSYSEVYGGDITDEVWFNVEPISWIVLEAEKNGEVVDLNSLFYNETNKMFYVDQLCGKAFSGRLILMSAYALDANAFNTGLLDYPDFSGSNIQTFLEENIGLAYALGNNILKDMIEKEGNANYIDTLLLPTHYQSISGFNTTEMETSMFLLAGHDKATEAYHTSKYFSSAPEEDKTIASSSVAVASPTDYAIAHYAETSANMKNSNYNPAYASPRGWAVGTAPSTTATCTYWTRSAHNGASRQANVVNTRGSITNTAVVDPHITVRPCMVLDIGFYYNGIF